MRTEEYYEGTYKETVLPMHLVLEPDLRIADGAILQGKEILSLGCGTGTDVAYLVENNKVYGIDIIEDALKIAAKNGLEALKANVEDGLPYADEMFDIVIVKDILEHVFYPEKVMAEVRRVLRPNGYAIVDVPNHFFYRMRLRLFLGKGIVWYDHPSKEWNYFHIRFFTFKGFNEFLSLCRFKPLKFFFDFGSYCYSSTMYYDQSHALKHRIIRLLLPNRARNAIANIRPNFFCGSFYAKVVKGD